MISYIKKRALLFIILLYIILLFLAGLAEDIELYIVLFTIFYTLLVVLPWLIWQVIRAFRVRKELKQAELQHLKSQVNPHFFFNTLNLLYGTLDKDKELAKEMILKLSDLMRYSIYNGQNELVTLEEEVAYLRQYIDLQQTRFRREIDISMEVDISDEGFKVMPLLFIILVENAFKHGAENLRHGAIIKIAITADKKEVDFQIENNFDPEIKVESGGLGLRNLKRRLELGYPKGHNFRENSKQDIHKARLILKKL
ncbi:MAG: histidine kinase [Ekhidna sp.]|nr:histidine kinase [Ekhidna sp.]